jgi:hypothetical protein
MTSASRPGWSRAGAGVARARSRWLAAAGAVVALVALAAGGAGVLPASAAGPACDDSWTNASGGAWTTAGNWSAGVPSSAQSVCITIPVGAPVTASNITVAGLTVGAATGAAASTQLTLTGTNTINGDTTITGAGKLVTSGNLTQGSGTLTNDGTLQANPNLVLQGAGNVTNGPDGFLAVTGQLKLPGPGTFTNEGELVVSSTGQILADPSPGTMTFDNAGGDIANARGDMEIQSGATLIQGDGMTTGTLSNARAAVEIVNGTLDDTGDGAGTFVFVGGTLEGTVAPTQLVQFIGTVTTSGPVENDGQIVGLSGGTLDVPGGTTFTNAGTFALRAGAMNLTGAVDNGSTGTIAVSNGAAIRLVPPYDITNDGTLFVAASAGIDGATPSSGQAASIENDGGTIVNGTNGGIFLRNDTTFVQGDGTTTGYPVQVLGTIDLTGSGAANLDLQNGTLSGDVSAGQTVAIDGNSSASGSFDNAGTMPIPGRITLPSGTTLTNDGTIGIGFGESFVNGNLTNASDGIMSFDGSLADAATSAATFDNRGELYLPNQDGIGLAPGVAFTNEGDIRFGVIGGDWGGFGLHAGIQANGAAPQTIRIGGSLEPVYEGFAAEPSQWVSPKDDNSRSISYDVAVAPQTTSANPDDITCNAATSPGFSLACTTLGYLNAITLFDNAPGIVPTTIALASDAPVSNVDCFGCPTTNYGEPVTITATVAPAYGSTAPTGTVTFFDGTLPVVTRPLSTSGGVTTATMTTSSLFIGEHQIWALYNGDSGNLESNSAQLTEAVNAQSTSVSVGASAASAALGQPVTLTATVTPALAGPQSPTGQVLFYSGIPGSTLLGVGSVSTSGGVTTASFTTTALPPGSADQVSAVYDGDQFYTASSSSSSTVAVALPVAPTTVTVSGPSSQDPGTAYSASAGTDGGAPAFFALAASPPAPGGLAIDPATGAISYHVPASGVSSFGYEVVALNAAGRAQSAVQTVTVPTAQTISFSAPSSGVVNGADALSPTASSGLAVALTVDSSTSPSGACTLAGPTNGGYTVTYVHAGSCVLDADQAGGSGYLAAPEVQQTIAIQPATQTITFTAPTSGTVNGSDGLTATASSGLTVSFSVDASTTNSACSLSGTTVTYLHTGNCVIDADQAGDSDYQAAPAVTQTITVGPAAQTINFTSTAPTGATVGGPTYTPAASASSGLPVTIELDSSGSGCTLTGGVVSFTAPGTCVIDATQPGNADYQAATPVQQTIPVTGSAPGITPSALEALTLGDVQGSPAYAALKPAQKKALTTLVAAAISVLNRIGPTTPPAAKAVIVGIYDIEVAVLERTGFLTAAQATTLIADAKTL